MTEEKTYIYGKHAVAEALKNTPKAIEKIFLDERFSDAEIKGLIQKSNILTAELKAGKISHEIYETAVHQGIVAVMSPKNVVRQYKEFIQSLDVTPDIALVLLNEIQDPQNVGAIIRSAAAFGIAGVLMPSRNQGLVTGAVAKTSVGMAFRIPVVEVGNVNTTLLDLKDKGFWIYGLDGESPTPITEEKFEAPTVFVLGNEAEGIRAKTLETCDIVLSIPTHPQCESLNAAASAAVALYTWSTLHPNAITPKK